MFKKKNKMHNLNYFLGISINHYYFIKVKNATGVKTSWIQLK